MDRARRSFRSELAPHASYPQHDLWHVHPMPITDKHREAESRFRKLLTDAALPPPDTVEYDPESVVFLWHEPKVAVFVDFDQDQRATTRSDECASSA
jgi:hypothetical protein